MFGPSQAEFDALKNDLEALKNLVKDHGRRLGSLDILNLSRGGEIDMLRRKLGVVREALEAKKEEPRCPQERPWYDPYKPVSRSWFSSTAPVREKTNLERRIEDLECQLAQCAPSKDATRIAALEKAAAEALTGRFFVKEATDGTGMIFEAYNQESSVGTYSVGVRMRGYLVDIVTGRVSTQEGFSLSVSDLLGNWKLVPKDDEKRVRDWRRLAVTRNEQNVKKNETQKK